MEKQKKAKIYATIYCSFLILMFLEPIIFGTCFIFILILILILLELVIEIFILLWQVMYRTFL